MNNFPWEKYQIKCHVFSRKLKLICFYIFVCFIYYVCLTDTALNNSIFIRLLYTSKSRSIILSIYIIIYTTPIPPAQSQTHRQSYWSKKNRLVSSLLFCVSVIRHRGHGGIVFGEKKIQREEEKKHTIRIKKSKLRTNLVNLIDIFIVNLKAKHSRQSESIFIILILM